MRPAFWGIGLGAAAGYAASGGARGAAGGAVDGALAGLAVEVGAGLLAAGALALASSRAAEPQIQGS